MIVEESEDNISKTVIDTIFINSFKEKWKEYAKKLAKEKKQELRVEDSTRQPKKGRWSNLV